MGDEQLAQRLQASAPRHPQPEDFIRGDRSLEGSDSTGYTVAKPFRERFSRQGDIVNSDVWYVGAPASNYALKGYLDFTSAHIGFAGGLVPTVNLVAASTAGTTEITVTVAGLASNPGIRR